MTEPEVAPRRSARVASRVASVSKEAEAPRAPEPKKRKTEQTEQSSDEVKPVKPTSPEKLSIGDALPDIVLKDQDDEDVNLSEIAKKSTVVLFAYPKASTPGCTVQAKGFRDKYSQFQSSDAAVYGISADPVKSQKNFQTKQSLPYQLLSDPNYQLIGPLGAKKSPKGIVRSHWIFKDGKLAVSAVGISPVDSFTKALAEVLAEKKNDKADEVEEKKDDVKSESGVDEAKPDEEKLDEPKLDAPKKEEAEATIPDEAEKSAQT